MLVHRIIMIGILLTEVGEPAYREQHAFHQESNVEWKKDEATRWWLGQHVDTVGCVMGMASSL